MKNFKWGTESFNDSPVYVVLFVSRKKDNKDIEGFVERRKSFITHKEKDSNYLKTEFKHFVEDGLPGEMSRMYYSINARNGERIHKALLHFLIDNPNFNLCSIMPKIAGFAAQKENAAEKKWMFDFDIDDFKLRQEFLLDISKCIDKPMEISYYRTPHGYAIITERGFDCRKLMEKWGKDVTLKRDDLLCVDWKYKEKE